MRGHTERARSVGEDGSGPSAPDGRQGFVFGDAVDPIAALSLRARADGIRIDLLDADGKRQLALGPFELGEAVTVARAIEDASGLQVFGCEGTAEWLSLQAAVKPAPARRRNLAVLNGRRPRFLVRRKAGCWPRRPLVYRESELADGCGS